MKRILILDDDSDFRKLIMSFLSSENKDTELIEYDPVAKGIPGAEFDWSSYGVLILDYNLGVNNLTGIDVLNSNKNNNLFPATIMLTGEGDEEIAVRALKSGVTDYLRKGQLKKGQLKASVEAAFESYNLRQNRRYSLDEVRQLAKQEAQKILSAYKAKYDQVRLHEESRLKAERLKLEEELKKNQAILDEIIESNKQAEKHRLTTDQELVELRKSQEEARAAVLKTNWKMDQGEEITKHQLDEDLKNFEYEIQQQEKLASDLSAELVHKQKLKEVEMRKEKVMTALKNKHLGDDVSSQLDKDN